MDGGVAPEPEPSAQQLLAAVRTLREGEATMGFKKMVKELKRLHPDWGGLVKSKAVREALQQLDGAVRVDEEGAAAASASVEAAPPTTGSQRKKLQRLHSIISAAVSEVASAARGDEVSALTRVVARLDRAAPRDKWVHEWAGGLSAHCAASSDNSANVAQVYNFGLSLERARRAQRSVPADLAVELQVMCYKQALGARTREDDPEKWATGQMNLGNAYGYRILGDAASNKEDAIQCYQQALEVQTREAYPENWAATQVNLGAAYCDRIDGDAARNKEDAIECLKQALEVYTREADPENWAETQTRLGVACVDRIGGGAASNKEDAIGCFKRALEVYTLEANPEQWAGTQMNLGRAYHDRFGGGAARNNGAASDKEDAIECFMQALKVCTRKSYPENWAETQMNLGAAYCDRIRGDAAKNKEDAIECFKQALEVYTLEADPQQWARTRMNLGVAYNDRILSPILSPGL